jgi:ribulose 1,5-bisphosphate carboxylase large subunit-like protein
MPDYAARDALQRIDQDLDAREELIRRLVVDHLPEFGEVDLTHDVVATYFVVSESKPLLEVGRTIAYHQTTAAKHPEPGTLLASCTGHELDRIAFSPDERIGLVRVAFPLAMLLDDQGRLYSTDLLHVTAGAGVFALREFPDIKLVDLAIGADVLRTFPGPAFGPEGIRQLANYRSDVAFGTIIKPCTGLTAEEVAATVAAAAANQLFLFVKEDEELLPAAPFCPLRRRVRLSTQAIADAQRADGSRIIYAPHVGSHPGILLDHVRAAVEEGGSAIMFSEYYLHGSLRLVRDALAADGTPVVIYGHNGGIDVHTRHIWREVLDLVARLDGMDIRQTGVLGERSLLRPAGLEWRQVEGILTRPIDGIRPVMIARAGGLDQGNVVPNLADIERHGDLRHHLLLAGSAINGFTDETGRADPVGGAQAMRQALEAYADPEFDNSPTDQVPRLRDYAEKRGHRELSRALDLRYGAGH